MRRTLAHQVFPGIALVRQVIVKVILERSDGNIDAKDAGWFYENHVQPGEFPAVLT